METDLHGPPEVTDSAGNPGPQVTAAQPGLAARPVLPAIGEMVLCSGFPTQIGLAVLVRAAGLPDVTSDGQIALPFVAVVSLADTALLVALMLWFLQARGQSAKALWLGSRPLLQEAVRGVLLTPLILTAVGLLLLAIQRWAPELRTVPVNPLEALARRGAMDAAILGVVAVIAGAVREELQRAFLVDRFERYVGPAWAGVIVLSVLFGVGHVLQGWDAAIATGVLGACWAIIYLRRRSIVMPLVSHALFNSLEIVRMLGKV
jgi:membrane protease YdiL (CAAX protease family)